jgi:WD40 repeat protein
MPRRRTLALLGTLAALCGAAVVWTGRDRAPPPEPPPAGTDADDEPLPPWAVCRIGTTRFRDATGMLAFTPDGRSLVTLTHAGRVRVLDRESGRTLREFPADRALRRPQPPSEPWDALWWQFDAEAQRPSFDHVFAAAVASDASRVALRDSNSVTVHDVVAGRRTVAWRSDSIGPIAWTPGGRCVVVAGPTAELEVRDAASAKRLAAVEGVPVTGGWSGTNSVAVSPDGKKAAVRTSRLRVIDLATGGCVFSTAVGPRAGPTAFSPDGAFLLTPRDDGRSVLVRETETWAVVRELPFPASAIVFSSDGSKLAITSPCLRVLDFSTGTVLRQFLEDAGPAEPVVFSPDGRSVATIRSGAIRTFDLASGKEKPPPHALVEVPVAIAWSADGTRLAVADGGRVRVCDPRTGTIVATSPRLAAWTTQLEFSPGRIFAVSPGREGAVIELDPATGSELRRWERRGQVGCSAGRPIAFASHLPARVTDVETGAVLHEFTELDEQDLQQTQLDAGRAVLVTLRSRTFTVRDARTGEIVSVVGTPAALSAESWEASRGRIVVRDEGRVAVLDAASGRLRVLVTSCDLWCAVVSDDGRFVAAFDPAFDIRVFDGEQGDELAVLRGHRGGPCALEFSPNGDRLASASEDGTVLVWDVAGATRR